MALRDQPYLPLYVQDFLTDEKLNECSAESTGVYIRLMCILHKSEEYGAILLKQKDKQTEKQILNFARKLARQMPYDELTICRALQELFDEGVITIDGDKLLQKRMVKDGYLSEIRAKAGKKGGKGRQLVKGDEEVVQSFAIANIQAKKQAKKQANSENEIEYENEDVSNTDELNITTTAREAALGAVLSHYQDCITPTPPSTVAQLLIAYTDELGADVVIHAIDEAVNQRKLTWGYIQAILQRYSREGLNTLAKVEADEAERRKRTDAGTNKPAHKRDWGIRYTVDGRESGGNQ